MYQMNLLERLLILYNLNNKKEIFIKLVDERASEIDNLGKINPDNLIYNYKIEGKLPKDFRNY